MPRYDVNISHDRWTAFQYYGYRAKGKGFIKFYTHNSWGQDYGKAWHTRTDSGHQGQVEFTDIWFLRSEDRNLWQSNRYFFGSRYRHRKGSRYQVRTRTHIKHKNGTTYLKPGDWVGINQGQGWCSKLGGSYFRCDGFYRAGRWYELSGGYVNIPTKGVIHTSGYKLKMWGLN